MDHHDRSADELEQEADRMDEQTERLQDDIDGAREDWETKQDSESVPGAVPLEPLGPPEDPATDDESDDA